MFSSLTDTQWALLEPLFITPAKRGRGKPKAPWRMVLNSILFVLLTGAKWSALPKAEGYATKSVAHRWFVKFDKSGLLTQVLDVLRERSEMHSPLIFAPKRRNRTPAVQPDVTETLAFA